MAHPGQDMNEDYIERPYKPDWMPIPSREWALAYINEDRTENYLGFREEFKKRYPLLTTTGQSQVWIPESVDAFVRVDQFGTRQDYDHELAAIPLDEDEIKLRDAELKRRRREKRLAALRARGLNPGEMPGSEVKRPGRKPKARAGDAPNLSVAESLDQTI